MLHDGRDGGRSRWRIWLVAMLFLPAVAIAQGADELASTIEQSLASIEFRIDVRPEQAAQDLQEQERRLQLLEEQAPEHAQLPALREKFASLQEGVASSLATAAGDVASGSGASQIPTAPQAFTDGLAEVGELQKQAEAAFLMGETAEAAGYLEEAEGQMAELEQRYAGEIPQGHATLLVTKEKLAALKDQLDQKTSD